MPEDEKVGLTFHAPEKVMGELKEKKWDVDVRFIWNEKTYDMTFEDFEKLFDE